MRATQTSSATQESPASNSYQVVPTDDVELVGGDYLPRALYVGVGGNITMALEGDETPRLFISVPTGFILPVKARIIMSTGTTASGIVALY
jgi:hypothetical protein